MGNCSKKRFFSIRDQDRAPGAGMWVFSGITKRITLLKQRNWRRNRAPCAETGCFGDLQNELRCKNNGIGEETARWTRERGVLGIHKTNSVVKTTELGRKPRAGRGNVGVFGNHKINYVVKTTEFAGNWRGTLDLEG